MTSDISRSKTRQLARVPPKGGPRPLYTKDLAEEICRELAEGRTLRDIAADRGMPAAPTVRDWVRKNIDGFAAAYVRARNLGRQALADEILEIADGRGSERKSRGRDWRSARTDLERDKLRVSARQWLLSVMKSNGERGEPLVVNIVRYAEDEDPREKADGLGQKDLPPPDH